MHYSYRCKGTCSQIIEFDLNEDKVTNIKFMGGCPGNLKAISKLVDGWSVEKINQYFNGTPCGYKPPSCADQLAIAVKEAYDSVGK